MIANCVLCPGLEWNVCTPYSFSCYFSWERHIILHFESIKNYLYFDLRSAPRRIPMIQSV